MKITLLQADVDVFGEPRSINWEKGEAVFAIFGVRDYDEAQKIMVALGIEQPYAANKPFKAAIVAVDEEVQLAAAETASAATRGQIPLAAPVTQPVKDGEEKLKFDLPASGAVPAKHPFTERLEEKSSPKESASPSNGQPRTVGDQNTSDEDFGAFANMASFGEAVAEIRKRGHETYEAILAFCLRLQGIGDVCPPLDQLTTGKGPEADRARLEDRLKTHLTGKGIKVPA